MRVWVPQAIRVLLVVAMVSVACGDGDANSDREDVANETVAVQVPTTFVILRSGTHSGTVGDTGAISFAVFETEESTGETVAGGQIELFEYELRDLQVVVDLTGFDCDGETLDGLVEAEMTGPIPVTDSISIEAESEGMSLNGSVFTDGGSGELSLQVTASDGTASCTYGPVSWQSAPD